MPSLLLALITACNATKNVPDSSYLLDKNKIVVEGGKLSKEDLNEIIRQQPNYKQFGVRWKLYAYNLIDSAKVAEKRQRKNIELRAKNRKRLQKEDRINSRRIDRAKRKGKAFYTHKTVQLKDTVEPNKFLREWYKYKVGRPPVIFDSTLFDKSIEQLSAYLRSKGYYYGEVNGVVDYKKKKSTANYLIQTGPRYMIDSVYLVCKNYSVKESYKAFVHSKEDVPLIGQPFDADLLDSYRSEVSKFMRDSSFYGFSTSSIRFIADTTGADFRVRLGVEIGDRIIQSAQFKDSVELIPYQKYCINYVYFHLADTVNYEGNFVEDTRALGLRPYNGQFLHTLDTLFYDSDAGKDLSETHREAYFLYNGRPYVKPRILEIHNYLDHFEPYSEKNVDLTYNSLRRMDMFNEIKVDLIEDREYQTITVRNYLVRGKKQNFSVEPRATNMNGFLGVSATLSYVNRNLFRGAERLKFGLSGGFESQPAVFEENPSGELIQTASRSFNTLEISPSVEVRLPGFFPFRSSKIAKKRRPQTFLSGVFNYQRRVEFERSTFQMNYYWQFVVSKTQLFEIGFPLASSVRFINIDKTDDFESKLTTLNDVFLLDAYSNQFVWQDLHLKYEYNNTETPNKRFNTRVYFSTTFDPAGNMLSLFRNIQDTLSNGKYAINGVAYSQFSRLDNELIIAQPLGKERSLNFRLSAGAAVPYGNSENSVPYDFSFFAGGANDIRGWDARTIGPGIYKYYLDSNRTITQLGNIKLGLSGEVRFAINSFLKGAWFVDAGNIWTFAPDDNRVGSEFSKDWYKQIMVGTGFGLRIDLEYFIFRLDLAIPLYNPALSPTRRWWGENLGTYRNEVMTYFGLDPQVDEFPTDIGIPNPYLPHLHFGIGYPF
jgi:outer membrane protein insertion porin family